MCVHSASATFPLWSPYSPEEVGVVWRSWARVLSLQGQADLSFWRLFWKHDLSLVCGALLFNYFLLFLRVVVGTMAARPRNSGIQMPAQCWCSERAVVSFYTEGCACVWGVEPQGPACCLLNVRTLDLHVCGHLCVDHIVPWRRDAPDRFCTGRLQSPLSCFSSSIGRALCEVDGKGLGFAADRSGFESWLNS